MVGWRIYAFLAGLMLVPKIAQAQQISTLEHGSWEQSLRVLQEDPNSVGQIVHVRVTFEGSQVQCSRYTIVFDTVGQGAFSVGSCNPADNTTTVTLINRNLLFDTDPVLAMPRRIRITALVSPPEVQYQPPIVEPTCRAEVRPVIHDLRRNVDVGLTPPRFILRSNDNRLSTVIDNDHWVITTTAPRSPTIEYDIIDSVRNMVVLHSTANLVCSGSLVPGTLEGNRLTSNSSAEMSRMRPYDAVLLAGAITFAVGYGVPAILGGVATVTSRGYTEGLFPLIPLAGVFTLVGWPSSGPEWRTFLIITGVVQISGVGLLIGGGAMAAMTPRERPFYVFDPRPHRCGSTYARYPK